MSRYIKTDALMEDIWSLYRDEDHIDYNVAIVDALNVIDEQPTADVVEVVRCGFCKWLKPDGKCKVFADYQIIPSASDYCSYGQRREDEI